MRQGPDIELAWQSERDPDLDLQEYAKSVLRLGMKNLMEDGSLQPVAFVFAPSQIHCFGFAFESTDEKYRAYGLLVSKAKALGADAIITLNDARAWNVPPEQRESYLKTYYSGKLQDELAPECILVSLSGPELPIYTITVPYFRVDREICFGEEEEDYGGKLGLLEGWAKSPEGTGPHPND